MRKTGLLLLAILGLAACEGAPCYSGWVCSTTTECASASKGGACGTVNATCVLCATDGSKRQLVCQTAADGGQWGEVACLTQ